MVIREASLESRVQGTGTGGQCEVLSPLLIQLQWYAVDKSLRYDEGSD
jgi:hypothetical protein